MKQNQPAYGFLKPMPTHPQWIMPSLIGLFLMFMLWSQHSYANEICTGSPGNIFNRTFNANEFVTCTATPDITLGPNVTIASGASVTLYASKVTLEPPVSILSGATLTISNSVEWRDPDLSDLTVSWHQDEDGDQVSAASDNCRVIYNPDQSDIDGDGQGDYCDSDFVNAGNDSKINDLRAEHVSPYGGWFSFTSYADVQWGYDIRLVWSTNASQLLNIADLQSLIDQGQSQLKRILPYKGLNITKPYIVTRMEPATQYYVVAVRELWNGLDENTISNPLTITTHAEPVINLPGEYPRMWSNSTRNAEMKQRYDAGDQELLSWINAFSPDVVEAANNSSSYRAWSMCQSAADIYAFTGDATYLAHAKTILDQAIAYWSENTLTGNQFRWADSMLAKCVDLLWNDITIEKKEQAFEAILQSVENQVSKNLRIEDTDQTIANIRGYMLEGILMCNAPGISSTLQQRGCAVLDAGKRYFYGLEIVRIKRAYDYQAHAGGAMPDGSFYGSGTGGYWMEIFDALINSGNNISEYSGFFTRRLHAMFLHALLPSGTGLNTYGDIESFTGEGREVDTSPVGGTIQLASLINVFNELGMTTQAGYAKFYFNEHFSPENSTFTTSQNLLHLSNSSITPIDYRTKIPTSNFASGMGIFTDRSNWQTDASYLAYRGGQMHVDHIHSDNGHFQLYRKGRWLTHESISYDGTSAQALGHNVLTLEGSTIYQNQFSGLGSVRTFAVSSHDIYSFMASDLTGVFEEELDDSVKRYDTVQRAIIWLKRVGTNQTDYLMIYDFVKVLDSAPDNMAKTFQLHFDAEPVINGRHAQVSLPGTTNQVVDVDFVFPASTTLSKLEPTGVRDLFATAPYTYQLHARANTSRDLRMVTVIQGNDQGVTYVPATGVESTTLIGAIVNGQLTLFPINGYANDPLQNHEFSLTAEQVSSIGTITAIITGLSANTSYAVNVTNQSGALTVQVQPGEGYKTDYAGVLLLALSGG